MAGTFTLEVATPERLLIKESVEEVQIPAAGGYIGVLAEHAPLVSELGTGALRYKVGGYERSLSICGGWVEVLPDRTRVLATAGELADEIDTKRAADSLHRAEERLAHPVPGTDIARALNAMKRAQARLAAARQR